MDRPTTRLVLLPGLGADGRLFEPQRRGLPSWIQVEVPPWIEPERDDESIESYARRIAQLIVPVAFGDTMYIGGVSFGALVALEAARHVPNVEGIFMIGGCRDTRAIAPFFRFACRLAPWIPLSLFRTILYGAPAALVLFESLNWERMQLYSRMINDASTRQVRWSAGALLNYRSVGDPSGVRVRSIHGQRDLLIAPKNVNPDYVILRGRHLVNLSHPDLVNEILTSEMTQRL